MTVSVDGDIARTLMDMDPDGFKDIVERDIRNRDNNQEDASFTAYADALRTAEVVERWYECLVKMKKSTELTIAAKSIDDKALRSQLERKGDHNKAEIERYHHLRWKAGAIRFLTGVEIRLIEASGHRRLHFGAALPLQMMEERNRLFDLVESLRSAIEDHRDNFSPNQKPSEHDTALWRILDGLHY